MPPSDAHLSLSPREKSILIKTIKKSDILKGRNRRGLVKFINSFYSDTDTFKLPLQKNKVPTLGE